jgi:hypothetical protein
MTQREINLTASFSAMTNLDERRFAFLKETIQFYNLGNRAVYGKSTCVYTETETSPGCAIGRFIPHDGKFDLKRIGGIEYAVWFGNVLPEWMMAMGIGFLSAVQQLHDISDYWTETGLSHSGREEAMHIISQFIANSPPYDTIIVDGKPLTA